MSSGSAAAVAAQKALGKIASLVKLGRPARVPAKKLADTYVIGVSHGSSQSVADVTAALTHLRPAILCLELPGSDDQQVAADTDLLAYRSFVSGKTSFGDAFRLARVGYRAAVAERLLGLNGERTDHFKQYRLAQLKSGARPDEMAVAAELVKQQQQQQPGRNGGLGPPAEVWNIDVHPEVASARAWNQQDLLSNLVAAVGRWQATVPVEQAPAEWATTAPPGWARYVQGCDEMARAYDLRKAGDRAKLALDVGGTPTKGREAGPAQQVLEGAQLQVILYERDLCLTAGLHRAATAAAAKAPKRSDPPCVVAIVGLAHVPGIVGNWGQAIDDAPLRKPWVKPPPLYAKLLFLTGSVAVIAANVYAMDMLSRLG